MKCLSILCLLAISAGIETKAAKIYRCAQGDGSVVIQDRRCLVTDLQQIKPKVTNKSIPSKQPLTSQQAETLERKSPVRLPRQLKPPNSQRNSVRSPYFSLGWDGFIPANWVMQKTNSQSFQQLLLSQTQFKGLNDFRQGVKLTVYSNTMKTSGLGAFAQALQLYHQIRDNNTFELLDSQFKTHPSYKVFNIKYQNQKQLMLLTEFYIDEVHNDLFVLTVQANQSQWPLNWQLAEKIIQQL